MTPDHEPDALREQFPPYAPPPETQRLIDELYREELREELRKALAKGRSVRESKARLDKVGVVGNGFGNLSAVHPLQ